MYIFDLSYLSLRGRLLDIWDKKIYNQELSWVRWRSSCMSNSRGLVRMSNTYY